MVLSSVLAATLTIGSMFGSVASQATSPQATAQTSAKVPDTPAGKALNEFVASFNDGGDKRKSWLENRTTVNQEQAAGMLKQDSQFLAEHGPVTVVKVPQSSATSIQAIIRHAKSGAHGHLTIEVGAEAPHKVTNMQLRGATPEEIK